MTRDRVPIVEVMVKDLDEDWRKDYRRRLEQVLAQDEILILIAECGRV